MSETFHIIFAAIMTGYFAANALKEFRKGNAGWGWYYNACGVIAVAYLWFLALKATP